MPPDANDPLWPHWCAGPGHLPRHVGPRRPEHERGGVGRLDGPRRQPRQGGDDRGVPPRDHALGYGRRVRRRPRGDADPRGVRSRRAAQRDFRGYEVRLCEGAGESLLRHALHARAARGVAREYAHGLRRSLLLPPLRLRPRRPLFRRRAQAGAPLPRGGKDPLRRALGLERVADYAVHRARRSRRGATVPESGRRRLRVERPETMGRHPRPRRGLLFAAEARSAPRQVRRAADVRSGGLPQQRGRLPRRRDDRADEARRRGDARALRRPPRAGAARRDRRVVDGQPDGDGAAGPAQPAPGGGGQPGGGGAERGGGGVGAECVPRYDFRMSDRSQWPMRKYRLGEEPEDDYSQFTPSERVAMVWEITKNAWAFKDPNWRESEFRRDVVRIIRRGR